MRVQGTVEKNVKAAPANVFVIPPGTLGAPGGSGTGSTLVLVDRTLNAHTEVAARYIQNTGANPCYFVIGGGACDPNVNNHGLLASGNQVVINSTQSVYVWSALGTIIATLEFLRNDNVTDGGIIRGNQP